MEQKLEISEALLLFLRKKLEYAIFQFFPGAELNITRYEIPTKFRFRVDVRILIKVHASKYGPEAEKQIGGITIYGTGKSYHYITDDYYYENNLPFSNWVNSNNEFLHSFATVLRQRG
jgi:hypothetical protein